MKAGKQAINTIKCVVIIFSVGVIQPRKWTTMAKANINGYKKQQMRI